MCQTMRATGVNTVLEHRRWDIPEHGSREVSDVAGRVRCPEGIRRRRQVLICSGCRAVEAARGSLSDSIQGPSDSAPVP